MTSRRSRTRSSLLPGAVHELTCAQGHREDVGAQAVIETGVEGNVLTQANDRGGACHSPRLLLLEAPQAAMTARSPGRRSRATRPACTAARSMTGSAGTATATWADWFRSTPGPPPPASAGARLSRPWR